MATPANAPYKISQRNAESHIKHPRTVFVSVGLFGGTGKTARAMRDGKLMKSGRQRTTLYY